MTNPTLREEFEKAFNDWYRDQQMLKHPDPSHDESAEWAAKWMGEYLAKKTESRWHNGMNAITPEGIRGILKDLDK